MDMHACGALGCAPAHTSVGEGPARPRGAAGSEALVGAGQWLWDRGEGALRSLPARPTRTCGPRSPPAPSQGPRVLPHLPSPVLPLRPHSSSRPSHPSLHLAPRPPGLLCAPLSVGRWDELRSGSWISFPGDPRPPRGPESPLRVCLGRGCPGWRAALKGPQLRHSAQTRPPGREAFYPGGGFYVEGPGMGRLKLRVPRPASGRRRVRTAEGGPM